MKRAPILLLALGLCLCNLAPAFAADLPAQAGNVYDGAGMLSENTELALEEKLLDFENATTIGIAVATVPSLQGLDAVSFANQLGENWTVGSKVTNNGVIILLSKKERQLALRFGPGFDKAWGARTSQQVRDNTMIPQLKAGKPELAVMRGVDEVIKQVTAGGYVNRWSIAATDHAAPPHVATPPSQNLEPRVDSAHEEALAAERLRKQQGLLKTGGVGLLIALVLIAAMRMRQIRAQRRELTGELDKLTESLTHNLEQLPAMEQRLKASYPESMWGPALSAINPAAMERLLYTNTKRHDNAELAQQRDELRIANGSVERVTELLRRAEHGQREAPRILRELPSVLEATRAALHSPDVLPETVALLAPLEVRLGELQSQLPATEGASFDWANFGDSVDKLQAEAAQLRGHADSDVQQVQQARASVPQLLEQAQQKLASLRELNNGRYSDVDNSLGEMEKVLGGYQGSYNYSTMNGRDVMYMLQAVNNALAHAQHAETTYVTHTQPSSGSGFRGGSGGSSSWGGGGSSGGGSSFSGGSGGSSGW